jgi:hypothetical protein
VRALAASAASIADIGERTGAAVPAADAGDGPVTGSDRKSRSTRSSSERAGSDGEASDDGEADPDTGGPTRAPAVERRRAAEALIALWTDVARDVALCQRGLDRSVRDIALLDDARTLAEEVDIEALSAFIDRLGRAGVLIAGNASPELVLDDLALAWPRPPAGSRAA